MSDEKLIDNEESFRQFVNDKAQEAELKRAEWNEESNFWYRVIRLLDAQDREEEGVFQNAVEEYKARRMSKMKDERFQAILEKCPAYKPPSSCGSIGECRLRDHSCCVPHGCPLLHLWRVQEEWAARQSGDNPLYGSIIRHKENNI